MTDEYEPTNLITETSMDEIVGTLDPSAEAERRFLAALCWDDDPTAMLWRVNLQPVHFEDTDLAAILEVALQIRDAGGTVEMLSIAEELQGKPSASAPSLEGVLWKLTDRQFHVGQADFYAEQVLARYRRRNFGHLGTALREIAASAPASSLDSEVQEQIDGALSGVEAMASAPSTTDRTLAERTFGERPPKIGFDTPWPVLNRAIRGFRPGALYVLAGDTGLGKSALALQCGTALARSGTVLYVTMEMGEGEMQDRIVAQQTAVSLGMVETGRYPAGPVRDRVARFVDSAELPIVFETRTNLSHEDIRRTALTIRTPLSGIVIDYLGLMNLNQRKGENATDAIGRTTKAIKNLARDLSCPVLLLSQLNREAARSGQPSRHHLLGSGAIANDADVIMLLHRADAARTESLTLIVDKNRQGPEGDLDLEWQGEFVRAVDPSEGAHR